MTKEKINLGKIDYPCKTTKANCYTIHVIENYDMWRHAYALHLFQFLNKENQGCQKNNDYDDLNLAIVMCISSNGIISNSIINAVEPIFAFYVKILCMFGIQNTSQQ